MEKALPHLPEELVKHIEELAGIYRQPGYKELSESLKFLSCSKPCPHRLRLNRQQARDVIRHAILLQPLLIEIIFFFIEV